jgi:hypothetical protein
MPTRREIRMPLYLKLNITSDGTIAVRTCVAESAIQTNFVGLPIAKASTVPQALRAAAAKYAAWSRELPDVTERPA